ncbi:hypothetical protein PtA15_8A657 [Puccinia triticina]|uniref:Major facilitator superfamily (MFS) profile domain-containing protein n=1 Tax=Puccinia triticina TaxID=208348 RepID=A0ABY7CR52_9BASI|nr:uncharacterized protein PtA15_8A657 [Puccinia triticina]WAQ87751.1 hypothetical protein PtA15_8A657 [Puccinia triticina]
MDVRDDKNAQLDSENSDDLMREEEKLRSIPAIKTPQQKRALLKLDLLLIPTLGLFYFLSFLDRSNLGNVRIIGLQKDLRMTDHDFSMALTITFIPYILIELPSNLLVKRIGAGIQIPLIVTIWGLITCLQGLVTRTEMQFRIALFWGTICIAGAVSGLLTFEIIKLHGRWGHPGWSWVFLIEGFVTVLFGIIGFFVLPSRIESVWILTEAEKASTASSASSSLMLLTSSIEKYPPKSTGRQVWEAFKSPHVVLLNVAQFACAGNTNSLAYFTPTSKYFLFEFGYSPSATQLFSVPPFALAFLFLLGLSYWSDSRQSRGVACSISAALSIIGFAIFYASGQEKVRYGSLFLSVPGAYGVGPSLAAWTADNSEPHMRKATAIALGTMVANSGGLFSIFVLGHKPRYYLPTAINLFLGVLIIACSVSNMVWLRYAQKQKVARRNDILQNFNSGKAEPQGTSEQDVAAAQAWDHLGDQHPDFKYIY